MLRMMLVLVRHLYHALSLYRLPSPSFSCLSIFLTAL
jgi:hypothetical protein